MKKLKLQVWSADRQEKLADLTWEDNKTTIVMCMFDDDVKRMVEHGLDEWVGPPEDKTSRHTVSSDPAFLERLGSYLKRQSSFIVTLSELEIIGVDE